MANLFLKKILFESRRNNLQRFLSLPHLTLEKTFAPGNESERVMEISHAGVARFRHSLGAAQFRELQSQAQRGEKAW